MATSIINSDNGSVSGSTGLKTTGGDDGVLYIQNNGTTNVTVTSAGDVGVGTTSPSTKFYVSGGSAASAIVTLTDGATITPDFDTGNIFTVTLGGNRTMANPSNLVAGQSGSIFIVQDGTGSRTLTWGSYWDFINGVAPTLSTTASAVDRIDYVVRSATSIHTVFTANYS
jgi:hypothetical protein